MLNRGGAAPAGGLRLRWLSALLAAGAFLAGGFLALHHPLWPRASSMLFVCGCVAAMRWPGLWLFALPACLPAMSFAPWTGWIAFEEFDFAVLAAIAGGHARRAIAAHARPPSPPGRLAASARVAVALFALSATLAWLRGLGPTPWSLGWYDGETDPLNALRTYKSLPYALAFWPLLRDELAAGVPRVAGRLTSGMLTGACIVVAATVWERAAYPGLLDFSDSYRTVALFWEMHVGGAAIDAYLALAVPFVAGAVASARTTARWAAAAILAVLMEYTCLTTFSRGVYLAGAGGLLVLAWQMGGSAGRVVPAARGIANRALVAVLLVELVAVMGADSFLMSRLKRSPQDFGSRLAHWRAGAGLLRQPQDLWLGKGLGRLPAAYAAAVPEHELSGRAQAASGPEGQYLRLSGPAHEQALAGLFAVTQRLPSPGGGRVELDVRVDRPVRLGFSVCELHLLYEGRCRRGVIRAQPATVGWQPVSVALDGPELEADGWPRRGAVFAISVLDAGAVAEIDNVVLSGAEPGNLLRNGDFAHDMARWFPAARHYFVPWHIDSLYLELLIEQGPLGLVAFLLVAACALVRSFASRNRGLPLAAVLVASLASVFLIGSVSSVIDVPRVSFLVFVLLVLSIELGEGAPARAAI